MLHRTLGRGGVRDSPDVDVHGVGWSCTAFADFVDTRLSNQRRAHGPEPPDGDLKPNLSLVAYAVLLVNWHG